MRVQFFDISRAGNKKLVIELYIDVSVIGIDYNKDPCKRRKPCNNELRFDTKSFDYIQTLNFASCKTRVDDLGLYSEMTA